MIKAAAGGPQAERLSCGNVDDADWCKSRWGRCNIGRSMKICYGDYENRRQSLETLAGNTVHVEHEVEYEPSSEGWI
jgi:hypothetical protein